MHNVLQNSPQGNRYGQKDKDTRDEPGFAVGADLWEEGVKSKTEENMKLILFYRHTVQCPVGGRVAVLICM